MYMDHRALCIAAILSSNIAYSGGFSLYTESSAAAIGNFAAGIAAEGYDASIGWYNPAGLVLLKKQEAVISGVGVLPSSVLSGTSTFNTDTFDPYIQSFTNLQGAENAVVPAIHYAKPLGERAAFGLSIVSPFGLSTDWGITSPVRYSATRTQLMLINLSPDLAGMITDHESVGLGLDLQWARVTFNSVIGSPSSLQYLESIGGLVTPTTLDSTSNNTGDSLGVGFHAGILGAYNNNHTRVGINYQSGVGHTFQGNSILTGRLADPDLDNPSARYVSNSLTSNHVDLPDLVTISGYQDLNERLALLGSVVYTGWSVFKDVELKNIAAFLPDSGLTLVNLTSNEDYRNTWRAALGANYHVTDKWMMRFGGGYDETPTVFSARDVRLPDSDRWALSTGAHYQFRPNLALDAGYTYLFASGRGHVNKNIALGEESSNVVNAVADNYAQLIGVQLVWSAL
jgi:long-chain fatty acid transport protein